MSRKKSNKKAPGPFDTPAQEIHNWVKAEYEAGLKYLDEHLRLAQQRAEMYAAAPRELVNSYLNGTSRPSAKEEDDILIETSEGTRTVTSDQVVQEVIHGDVKATDKANDSGD